MNHSKSIQYYLAQNGKAVGPYSSQEVERFLQSGQCKPSDLIWHEGITAWQPIAQIFPPKAEVVPPKAEPKIEPKATSTTQNSKEPGRNRIPTFLLSIVALLLLLLTLGIGWIGYGIYRAIEKVPGQGAPALNTQNIPAQTNTLKDIETTVQNGVSVGVSEVPRWLSEIALKALNPIGKVDALRYHIADLDGDNTPEVLVLAMSTPVAGMDFFNQVALVFRDKDTQVELADMILVGSKLSSQILLDTLKIEGNKFTASALGFGPDDAACCPSVRTQASFTLNGNKLFADKPSAVLAKEAAAFSSSAALVKKKIAAPDSVSNTIIPVPIPDTSLRKTTSSSSAAKSETKSEDSKTKTESTKPKAESPKPKADVPKSRTEETPKRTAN
jgi:hypothetical protein